MVFPEDSQGERIIQALSATAVSGPPDPLAVLRHTFGFDSFRGQQEDVIRHVMAGGSGLVLMPTGGGKSLCYQIPALCLPGTAIVVSPLIALMQNQVEALKQAGVSAAFLNSAQDRQEAQETERRMLEGEIDLLYVAPERLMRPDFMDMLRHIHVNLFAIDEAHCVSQWGHDFRPEYLQLSCLHENFPGIPRLALTATADAQTRDEILNRLDLRDGRVFVAGFNRPNIAYWVTPKGNSRKQLLQFITENHRNDSGIVYCLSRRKTEDTAAFLKEEGFDALPYHAGLDSSVRAANQRRFIREEGIIMTATIAFGMGIDKPDVRFVAHLDMPKTMEAYYQETGRAGRDGLPADAWMVYGMQDVALNRQMIESGQAPEHVKAVERVKLDRLLTYCETVRCRRQVLLEYFGDSCDPCGNCDTCLTPAKTYDGTVEAQKALSAIYRTRQIYGAAHIIDILTGAKTEKVVKAGHDALPTFGVGGDKDKKQWGSILRQLAATGIVYADAEQYNGLKFGPDAMAVMKGEKRIELRVEPEDAVRREARQRKGKETAVLETDQDRALFEALRSTRAGLAKAQGIPAYMVFPDTTLIAMVRSRPKDRAFFALLPGVGDAKLERYADIFLEAIRDFTERPS